MENINEIRMIYKYVRYSEIRILGDKFIENNKNKCRLIINGKEKECKAIISREDIDYENMFEIKIIGLSNVHDMSYMFSDCQIEKD